MKFEPFELKIGRNTYTITENDRILFNGNCYQLVTQSVRSGWYDTSPKLAKTKVVKYIKQGFLVEGSKTQSYGVPMIYYRFTGNPESKI